MTAFEKLLAEHSFCLQRISPATFPGDVITHSLRRGDKLTKKEADAIVALVRGGSCFRCRLGKAGYHYGVTADAAIEAALAAAKGKKRAKQS